jgi:ELWxxDGT repeat protein
MTRTTIVFMILLCAAGAVRAADQVYLVKDFPGKTAGSSLSYQSFWATIGDTTYFSAVFQGGASGRNVWKTDGTPEGTVAITTFLPYRQGHAQAFVGVVNGKLLYNGDIMDNGGLYMIDSALESPSTVRISLVTAYRPGLVHGTSLYYDAYGGLMRTDGTVAGTARVALKPSPEFSALVSWKDSLYYLGESPAGSGLHRWDGLSSQSTLVVPIAKEALLPRLQLQADRLYFGTKSSDAGPAGLWVSDGTVEGTSFLHETPGDAYSSAIAALGDKVLLWVRAGEVKQLWMTDGTAAGTAFLCDAPKEIGAFLEGTVVGSKFFFFENDGYSYSLYVIDREGVRKLIEASPTSFVRNGQFYFHRQRAGSLRGEWWVTDGTAEGTQRSDLFADLAGEVSSVKPLVRPDGLVFGGFGPDSGTEPWFYDFVTGQARMLKNIGHDNVHGANPTGLVAAGDKIFFRVDLPDGPRLAVSDGTSGGTLAQAQIAHWNAAFSGGRYYYLTGVGALSYLMATEDGTLERTEPLRAGVRWIAPFRDGVAFIDSSNVLGFSSPVAGTYTVEEIHPEAKIFVSRDALWIFTQAQGTIRTTNLVNPSHELISIGEFGFLTGLAEIGNIVYLLSDEGERVSLWRSDGTRAGTWRVMSIVPPRARLGTLQTSMVASGDRLFITAGSVLIRSDGSVDGTVMTPLPDEPEARQCDPSLVPFRGGVAGIICDWESKMLWVSDGTAVGSAVLSRMPPSSFFPPKQLIVRDGFIYFRGWDSAHGFEPWISDGTAGGTLLLADVNPGTRNSDPADFTIAGKRLFFSAYDVVRQRELWAIGSPFNGRARAVGHP